MALRPHALILRLGDGGEKVSSGVELELRHGLARVAPQQMGVPGLRVAWEWKMIFLTSVTRGPFLTSPAIPRGEIGPRGECSPLRSLPGVNTLNCSEESVGEQIISAPGDNFTPRRQNMFQF
jgi:hypothetical protein